MLILNIRRCGVITVFRVDLGHTERAHWPIPPVRTGSKYRITSRSHSGMGCWRSRYEMLEEAVGWRCYKKEDPLPGMRSRNYRGTNEGS